MEIESYGRVNYISVFIGKCKSMEIFNEYIRFHYLNGDDENSAFELGKDFGIYTYEEDFSLVNYMDEPTKKVETVLDTGAPDYVVTHFIEQYGEEFEEEFNCAVMFYDMDYSGKVKRHTSEKYGEFVFLGSCYSDKFDML